MATLTLSQVVGAATIPQLAADTTFFTTKNAGAIFKVTSGIDASAALTEVLGLTGKFVVSMLKLQSMTVNNLTDIKLTVDGVDIWNETGISSNVATEQLLGGDLKTGFEYIQCDSSLSLKVKMSSDTSIDVVWIARPII